MPLPTRDQAFAQGGPIFHWPEDQDAVASAARFNGINEALFGFIRQLESETGIPLADHESRLAAVAAALTQHAAALADRYTKAEADAASQAMNEALAVTQQAIADLNTIYQSDTEAAAAIAALSQQWDATSTDFKTQVQAWLNERYTKAETQALLSLKANKGDSYTKSEADDLLSGKAASSHNHTLHVGDGSFERMTLGTQERLNIKAGYGIVVSFNDVSKTVQIDADLQGDIDAGAAAGVATVRGGVDAAGDTLAKLLAMIQTIQSVGFRLKSDPA
jgi:hypothetical protein